jgi:hypothetical protein
MSLCHNTGSAAAPFTGQELRVHTLPFAFCEPEEDDESVKMSNTTRGRSSVLPLALLASRTGAGPLLKPLFLFDTNKPFAFITKYSARRKQSTSFFLFDTNEPPQINNPRSLITKARRIP